MKDLSVFLHVFIDPVIYISMGWIFILYFVLSNPTLLILLPKLFQPYELFCLTPVFFWYIPTIVEDFGLLYAPGLSCIFSVPSLESAIYQMSSGSFYCRTVLEIMIWVLGLLIATTMLLLLGPLSWQCKKNIHIYLYKHTHICIQIYMYAYTSHIYVYIYIHMQTYRHMLLLLSRFSRVQLCATP